MWSSFFFLYCRKLESESVQLWGERSVCLSLILLLQRRTALYQSYQKNCIWWKRGIIRTDCKRWKMYFRILNHPRPPTCRSCLKTWRFCSRSFNTICPGPQAVSRSKSIVKSNSVDRSPGWLMPQEYYSQLHLRDWPWWKWSQLI